jgi:hypothetical protein
MGQEAEVTKRQKELVKGIQGHLDALDTHGYGMAEKVWRLNKEEGLTQKEISAAVNRRRFSTSEVGRYVRLWAKEGPTPASDRPPFTEAYYALQGHGRDEIDRSTVRKYVREHPEVVEEEPDLARAIVRNPRSNRAITEATIEHAREQTSGQTAEERERESAYARAHAANRDGERPNPWRHFENAWMELNRAREAWGGDQSWRDLAAQQDPAAVERYGAYIDNMVAFLNVMRESAESGTQRGGLRAI